MKTLIPPWATRVVLVANGIDGYPPRMPDLLTVEAFLAQAPELDRLDGHGEWDVLVYAVEDPKRARLYPKYGRDHPYRALRSQAGKHVKLIHRFSYMHWPLPQFTR